MPRIARNPIGMPVSQRRAKAPTAPKGMSADLPHGGTLTPRQEITRTASRSCESPVQFLLNHGPRWSARAPKRTTTPTTPTGEAFAIRDVRSVENDAILDTDTRSRLERTG
jgi:hypothetical protein